ncbi:MAG: HAMP domain-containing sensor histidine kinase [Synechococcales bacterium]|nr:HAMP domain-containing sensor histidine kinase [Synechococcales bacterium]
MTQSPRRSPRRLDSLPPTPNPSRFVSLRTKLLVWFTVSFSLVFVAVFFWFYIFATQEAIARLRKDMQETLLGAAKGVDVDELLSLYADGQPNATGFSDDERYQRQLAWFDAVHQTEPQAWFYSFIIGNSQANRRVGPSAVAPGELELIYLVDLWARYDPQKASKFLESDIPSVRGIQVLEQKTLVEFPDIYTDRWGTWLSAAAPLLDESGNVVAVLGLDIEASYVVQLQQRFRRRLVTAFGVTYSVLFILIYGIATTLTRQLTQLSASTEQIAVGNYDHSLFPSPNARFPDEMNHLARVFGMMIERIRIREQLIREGQQVEHDVRQALQREKDLGELKSRFIAMVSHEFRTPLTVIRTSVELLQRFGQQATEAKRQDYFQRIQTAIQAMVQLIDDILTVGQAESGKLLFNPQPLDLGKFCADLIEEMRLSGDQGQRIVLRQLGEHGRVVLDPKLLRSLLVNLLSNALKYSDPTTLVDIILTYQSRSVQIEVRDRGIGIPPEDQRHLFESFYRGSNVSTIQGTGLGLQIVQQIVELHRGDIAFTSEEGVGTRFKVRLPIAPPSE